MKTKNKHFILIFFPVFNVFPVFIDSSGKCKLESFTTGMSCKVVVPNETLNL